MKPDLVVRSRRVVTPGATGAATVHIRDGVVSAVNSFDEVPVGAQLHDAGDLVVMPGLVDTHVHINEPGRTHWEGFDTATRAAAAGGITTLIEMPLNSIPATTTVAALQQKLAAARGKLHVDVGFWGGVVPSNAAELRPLYEAGVFGFKCFLVPSGVEEFAHVTEGDLRAALPILAKLNAPLLAHAELPGPIEQATASLRTEDPTNYRTWWRMRPPQAEMRAIELLIRLCRECQSTIHVVHLSAADALPVLRRAKKESLPITVETCPHYLYFSCARLYGPATAFKCAPPIRHEKNRQRLWTGLRRGVIDMVVSDHSPCPPEMKCLETGDLLHAWGGIASLQLSLSLMWTQIQGRGFGVEQLAKWMCYAPARLAGLSARKGRIAAGYDADLVIWDPDERFRVEPSHLYHRHKLTPYANEVLHGAVRATFVRGEKVYDRGEFSATPVGSILLRGSV